MNGGTVKHNGRIAAEWNHLTQQLTHVRTRRQVFGLTTLSPSAAAPLFLVTFLLFYSQQHIIT
jgi:hypothetical protein